MPLIIPFQQSLPLYDFTTVLDSVSYGFHVRWNGRDGAWFFDLMTIDGAPIAMGIKIVLGCFLGERCTDPNFPAGKMIVGESSGSGLDAGLDDMGSRVNVYYYTAAEVAALQAAAAA